MNEQERSIRNAYMLSLIERVMDSGVEKEEAVKKAQEMFDGQFPNDIRMNVPRSDFMASVEHSIRDELKEWIDVTIDKYKELVKEGL